MAVTIDLIYQSSPESDSEGGEEVYMVGNGEELPEKIVDKIQREAEETLRAVKKSTWWGMERNS
jgi:hypothetical protein